MEFPFGHQHTHHHHHHHQRDDEEENRERPSYPPPACQEPPFGAPPSDPPPPYFQEPRFGAPPPPPPSYYQETEFVPPPPTHVYHSSDRPEEFASVNYYPPASTPVTHVAHEVNEGRVESTESHHSYRPHLPSFLHHQSHSGSGSDLSKKPTMKVYCKAEPNFSLTLRDGKVILARSNPDDALQHWYKDEKYSTRVKDEEGFPCFALVNKATGQALKHSVGDTHPVQLIPYNTDVLDENLVVSMMVPLLCSGNGTREITNCGRLLHTDIYETCCRIEKLRYALPNYIIWRDHPVLSYSVCDIFCFFSVKIFVSRPAISLLWLSLYRSTCYVSMLLFQCVEKTNA
ncbi:hypothetical protein SLA2020_042130 [Shorea laevis]